MKFKDLKIGMHFMVTDEDFSTVPTMGKISYINDNGRSMTVQFTDDLATMAWGFRVDDVYKCLEFIGD